MRRRHVGPLLVGAIPFGASLGLGGSTALAADAPPAMRSTEALASISGHFALDATDGRKVTDATFRGKWLVVYFGYTSCPDICPTVILRIGQALASIGSTADQVQPIFITLDPARDTAEHLGKYMAAFDPRVIGLRGDAAQTREVARQFHVYYRTRSLGSGDYSVDHSSFLYVIDPRGHFSKLLADTLSADQFAAEFRALVKQGQGAKPQR